MQKSLEAERPPRRAPSVPARPPSAAGPAARSERGVRLSGAVPPRPETGRGPAPKDQEEGFSSPVPGRYRVVMSCGVQEEDS